MAKIEIDEQELKNVVHDVLTDILREGDQVSLDLKDTEIFTLRRQVATYKSMVAAYKEKIAAKNREINALIRRADAYIHSSRTFDKSCEEENEKLAKEVDRLNGDVKTYRDVVCDLIIASDKVKADADQEFEEAVRGDLMNLKVVKKYLDKVRPTAKTKDDYLKAMNIIDKDISNLDKFVEERWGHGED